MRQKLRLEVLKRDNHACQICFAINKKLQVHHIIPRRFSGSRDVLDNLVSVCHVCHEIVEYIKLKIPNSNRKSVRIELETKFWNKLKSKANENDRTVEDEANIMLNKYVE